MWMTSVRDWLMLVAAKISKSGATSTIPLFEGLRDAMVSLNAQVGGKQPAQQRFPQHLSLRL